jgi:hypothetical protein
MNSKYLADPDWYAFLYVAGEMTGEQREAFERLMLDAPSDDRSPSDDRAREAQLLREAVARSVELTGCVAHCIGEESSDRLVSRRTAWRRGTPLLTIGVAVCLAVMFLVRILGPSPSSVARRPGDSSIGGSSTELAIAWSETPRTWNLTGNQEETTALTDDIIINDADTEPWTTAEGNTDEDLVAPSWMLVALADLSAEMPHEEAPPTEN